MKKIFTLIGGLLLVATLVVAQETADNEEVVASDGQVVASDGQVVASDGQTVVALPTVTKAEGDSAYLRADYAAAIEVYEKLLQQGEAAEVYYNLGNSYYKVDDVARAILNYERALLLSPGNGDVRANLEIARGKTVDKVVPIPEIFFVSWMKSLINVCGADTWAIAGIVCFVLMLVGWAVFFVGKVVLWKKVGFIGGLVCLCLVVLCNVFAAQQKGDATERRAAIVLVPSITVRSTPSESGTSLFILHEGHKVNIKDNSMRGWKEIRLDDGKVGWLPSESIEVI